MATLKKKNDLIGATMLWKLYLAITVSFLILNSAVGLSEEMQDFGLESLLSNIDHSQKVKAIFERSDSNSKDYVYSPTSTAEFRLIDSIAVADNPRDQKYLSEQLLPKKEDLTKAHQPLIRNSQIPETALLPKFLQFSDECDLFATTDYALPQGEKLLEHKSTWLKLYDRNLFDQQTFWNFLKTLHIQGILLPANLSEEQSQKIIKKALSYQISTVQKVRSSFGIGNEDFERALKNEKPYVHLYNMFEINSPLLPEVPEGQLSIPIPEKIVANLKGENVPFWEQHSQHWGVSRAIEDRDGQKRRFCFLYDDNIEVPPLNFAHPSFLAQRFMAGEILYSIYIMQSDLLEVGKNLTTPALETSLFNTALVGGLIRGHKAFSFQRINLPLDELTVFCKNGCDFYFDYIGQTALCHTLLTKNNAFLYLTFDLLKKYKIELSHLMHALAYEESIDYTLPHLQKHSKSVFQPLNALKIKGTPLKREIVNSDFMALTGSSANAADIFTSSTIDICTRALNITDFTPKNKKRLQKAHLLLCSFNALLPGVFMISEKDLLGSYQGDRLLYGNLLEQLNNPLSFVNALKELLAIRNEQKIALSTLIKTIDLKEEGTFAALLRHSASKQLFLVLFNFTEKECMVAIEDKLFCKKNAINLRDGLEEQKNFDDNKIALNLPGLEYKIITFRLKE